MNIQTEYTLAPQVSKLVFAELSANSGLTSMVSARTLLKGVLPFFFSANLFFTSSSIPESLAGLESPSATAADAEVFDFVFVAEGVEVANLGFFVSGFSVSESDSELEEDDSAFRLVPEL